MVKQKITALGPTINIKILKIHFDIMVATQSMKEVHCINDYVPSSKKQQVFHSSIVIMLLKLK